MIKEEPYFCMYYFRILIVQYELIYYSCECIRISDSLKEAQAKICKTKRIIVPAKNRIVEADDTTTTDTDAGVIIKNKVRINSMYYFLYYYVYRVLDNFVPRDFHEICRKYTEGFRQ